MLLEFELVIDVDGICRKLCGNTVRRPTKIFIVAYE